MKTSAKQDDAKAIMAKHRWEEALPILFRAEELAKVAHH
jgi:hypothetical protein